MSGVNQIDESILREMFAESKLAKLVKMADEGVRFPDDIPIDLIRERVAGLYMLRETCGSDAGWVLQKESNRVRTLYRNTSASSHIHSIQLDGVVAAPVFTLLALFHEVDLFCRWLPTYSLLGLNFTRLIAHPSPTELLVHLNIDVPWPFTNRYCFFHCDGIDCMDDPNGAQIGVILTNLTSEKDFKVEDDGVKTTFHSPSGVLLTPLGGGMTQVQIVVNVDPQIPLVPDWLIDFAVRNLAHLIILQVRKAVEIVKNDAGYTRRMRDPKNKFYNHIKRRIRESLPQESEYLPEDDSPHISSVFNTPTS